MWTISELKENAKMVLNRSYWKGVLVAFVLSFTIGSGGGGGGASSSSSELGETMSNLDDPEAVAAIMAILAVVVLMVLFFMAIGYAVKFFLLNPVQVGCRRYFVLSYMEDAKLNEMGFSFKSGNYGNAAKTMFFRDLFIFLWSLLCIIPGIIKDYEYRMIPYLLAENPNMSREEAFELSKQMMYGEKLNAFILDLSFIGWNILSLFTCGILTIFYVGPYKAYTDAGLYLALRHKVMPNNNTTYTENATYTENNW